MDGNTNRHFFIYEEGGATEQTKYMETKPFYDPPTLKMTMDAQLNHILANTTRRVLSKVQSSVTWIQHLQVSVDKPCTGQNNTIH